MNRKIAIGLAFTGLIVALGIGSGALEKKARVEAAAIEAPTFEVDPLWPKPLPNHWLMGMTIGVSVDAQDNGRIRRSVQFSRLERALAMDDPHVVLRVDGNANGHAHEPVIRQRLWP